LSTYFSGFEVSSQNSTIGIEEEVALFCPRVPLVITTIAVIRRKALIVIAPGIERIK
jgi:hypothetical protein